MISAVCTSEDLVSHTYRCFIRDGPPTVNGAARNGCKSYITYKTYSSGKSAEKPYVATVFQFASCPVMGVNVPSYGG